MYFGICEELRETFRDNTEEEFYGLKVATKTLKTVNISFKTETERRFF